VRTSGQPPIKPLATVAQVVPVESQANASATAVIDPTIVARAIQL
jgi:hypothetical protein